MTDTEGILDRCNKKKCGARAGVFVTQYGYEIRCTECANMIVAQTPDESMVAWNKEQRK